MQRWKSCIGLILSLLLLAGGIWGLHLLRRPGTLPITSVKVYSDYQHIDPALLQQGILPFVNRGFFNVNVDRLKDGLQQLPWVYQVAVKRIWPDQVIIKIIPKEAVARWGQNTLLSAQGVVFNPDPKTFPNNLVQLNGPSDQVQLVWQEYLQMGAMLKPLGLTITELDLSQRHAWRLVLNNGMKILLGHEDVINRFQRFIAVYPQIINNREPITVVDLRYPNGLAVSFVGSK